MTERILFELTPLGMAIGWTLLHSLWQIFLVAALLNLTLRFVPRLRASLRYILLFSGLLLITCWAIATFGSVWEREYQLQQIALYQPAPADSGETSAVLPVPDPVHVTALSWLERLQINVGYCLPLLTIGWLLGVLFMTLPALLGLWHLRYLRRTQTQPLTGEWKERFQELCQRIGVSQDVEVLLSGLVSEPVTFSAFRPVILLPFSLFSGLTTKQVEALLLHELAHIRRYDYLFNILQTMMEVTFFYHPAIWWIAGQLREERENCCDDLVVAVQQDPFVYAEALTKIQLHHFSTKKRLAMSANGKNGTLTRRVKRLFGQYEHQHSAHKSIFLILFLLVMGVTTQSFSFSAPDDGVEDNVVLTEFLMAQDTLPVYVVNGEVKGKLQPGELEISPEDIERINVLKGESAISNYGVEAKYGVVEIWTKESGDKSSQDSNKASEVVKLRLADKPATVTGKVLTKDKKPIAGAKIVLKGGKAGTISDLDGNFVLKLPDGCSGVAILASGYKGFKAAEVCDGQLLEVMLDKVEVASGKIELNTGSDKAPMYVIDGEVVKADPAEIKRQLNPDDIATINVYKDKAAIDKFGPEAKNGVVEIWSKKSAAAAVEKTIKDTDSDKDPLYVIDGVVVTADPDEIKRQLKPDDIATMNVYKDKAAIEKYGPEAMNGVVEIWTKKSTAGAAEETMKKSTEKTVVNGMVTSSDGTPLIGSSIIITGTTEGTVSDLDGTFSIEVAKGDVLAVSYIGFPTKMVTIGEEKQLKIVLEQNGVALDEVVVTALMNDESQPKFDPQLRVFPNPAGDPINVEFYLKDRSEVKVSMYTVDGKLVRTVHNGELEAGRQKVSWRFAQNRDKGIYLIRLEINGTGNVYTKQIVIE